MGSCRAHWPLGMFEPIPYKGATECLQAKQKEGFIGNATISLSLETCLRMFSVAGVNKVLIGILGIFSGSGFSLKSDDKVHRSYKTYGEAAKPVWWTVVREKQ